MTQAVEQVPVLEQMRPWVSECKFEDYLFQVRESHGGIMLHAAVLEPDIISGELEWQTTRKWRLTPSMTKSEVIQTVFKCCLTSMEHRTRENFLYRGRRVFGPHFDVDALWGICNKLDYRKEGEMG